MPCLTSKLLRNLQYLDLSDNLLTDLTLAETLCDGDSPLKLLRVLNISGNALKVLPGSSSSSWSWSGPWSTLVQDLCLCLVQSLSTTSRLLARFLRLSHLDVSRNAYGSMAQSCSWPPSLTYLNLSSTRLASVSPCLPAALEVGVVPASAPPPPPQGRLLSRLCVQVLDLSNNDLRELVLVLPVLRDLHLSGNKLLRLPAGGFFPSLLTLTIQVRAPPGSWLLLRWLTWLLPHRPTAWSSSEPRT